MAAYTPTKLSDSTLGTASATLYTAVGTVILKEIILANTTGSAATATITAGGITLIPGVSIAGNQLVSFDFSKVMANADVLAGLASAATAISCFVSGVVIS